MSPRLPLAARRAVLACCCRLAWLLVAAQLACPAPASQPPPDGGAPRDAVAVESSGTEGLIIDAGVDRDAIVADRNAGAEGGAPDAGHLDALVVDSSVTTDGSLLADAATDASSAIDAAAEPPPPLVLLHLSDIHFGSGSFAVPAFELAVDDIIPTVAPLVTFASGDLVEVGNNAEAWADYRTHVDSSGLNHLNYIEVPGNHDIYLDGDLSGYLEHTLAGRADHGTHGLYSLSTDWGRLRVVALDTVGDSNVVNQSTGFLSTGQVDDLIAAMVAETEPAAITVALGHHPIDIDGLALFDTDDELLRVLGAAQADAYLHGHRHLHLLGWQGSCLFAMARTLGNPGDEGDLGRAGFNILIHDDGLTARGIPLDEQAMAVPWPVVMISRPANPALGSGNPRAQPLPRARGDQLLRALVFSPGLPTEVRYRVDDGAWQPMQRVGRHDQARFASPDAPECQLEVEATTVEGTARDIIQVELQ